MATWVTHLMIADKVLQLCPELDRHGFCIGNIAPDCNVENADWTSFTPSREITHWMSGKNKIVSDCDAFCTEYIFRRENEIRSKEEYSFLVGYYVHLITDALFQKYIRDDKRVQEVWKRIKANDSLRGRASGYSENWTSVRKLISKEERMNEIYTFEAEYLRDHKNSGYITEVLPLKEYPDYIDYLPHGSIPRKIGVMGYLPKVDESLTNPITVSREEFKTFIDETVPYVINKLKDMKLVE